MAVATNRTELTQIHTLMHWLYFILGGFYWTKQPSRLVRRLWFLFLSVQAIIIYGISFLGYFLTTSKPSATDIALVLWSVWALSYICAICPLVTYSQRSNIETVMSFVVNGSQIRLLNHVQNNESVNTDRSADDDKPLEKCNIGAKIFSWTVSVSLPFLAYMSAGVVDVLEFSESDSYKNLYQHLIPIPYAHLVPSKSVFFVLYSLECVIMSTILVVAGANLVFNIIITEELRNFAFDYCNQLRSVSKIVERKIEDDFKGARRHRRKNASITIRFQACILKFIKGSIALKKTLKLIIPYQNIFTSFMVSGTYFALFCNAYILMMTDLETIFKVKQSLVALSTLTYLFAACEMSKTIENMDETMILEFYNIPWYYMPPDSRKIVYVFLCQAQYPIRPKALRVYPVNMVMIPRLLNGVYGWVNVLRRVISK